jgi:hypothetical protein
MKPTHASPVALAVVAALGAAAVAAPSARADDDRPRGTYVAGDFHNHTTCSDGSISMQKLVKKSTDRTDTPWGLDWFVQAGHGGSGNRNCTLVEDASLATPAYPVVTSTTGALQGPTTTWQNSNPAVQPKGLASGTAPGQNMWRWQSLQEFQYPLIEYLNAYNDKPLFLGLESVVAGHEHSSMSVITGQIPASLSKSSLPTQPPYAALGNANALAQWEYCFDRADGDTSRGNATVGTTSVAGGNNWHCGVPGSLNETDVSWNATAQKLVPAGSGVGSAVGTKGHAKTVEALKWLKAYHPKSSYYVPAHLERAGPFNPDGNNGYNVEHLRNFNNAAPEIAFGFETQPGHGASDARGEYTVLRNGFTGATTRIDSVGGTTYGGTGVYGAVIGGVWDSLLGEGRNWWFFASSDWHNRGSFGPDDRRSSQDFLPGEYQRNYTLVRNGDDDRYEHDDDHGRDRRDEDRRDGRKRKLTPQQIVDGLRTGNTFASSGQLIDRLAFVACVANGGEHGRSEQAVRSLALEAALKNTSVDKEGCATMGEHLKVRPGSDVVVAVVVRDPSGTNYSPYSFDNPSLLQAGIRQPLNRPELDRVDVIRGLVTGLRQPGAADYAGEWPRNTAWLKADGTTADLSVVPAAAKNTTAALYRTFNEATWETVRRNPEYKVMSFRLRDVSAAQYLRLRGSNLPAAVPFETDAAGNPLSDIYTNAIDLTKLRIPCTAVGTNVPANGVTYTEANAKIDGCPNHLPVVNGTKYVAYDVAAWADLWFYSNPIYVDVTSRPLVARAD